MRKEKGDIYGKIVAIQKEIEAIEKTKSPAGGLNYKFRGIDDMYNHIHPLHKKHGVFIVPRVVESVREQRVVKSGTTMMVSLLGIEYDFMCEDGSKITAKTQGEAMDSGDKATNKAMSIALKYALMHMYLIPTEDIQDSDPDESAEVFKEVLTDEQFDELKEVLTYCEDKDSVMELWEDRYLEDDRVKSEFDSKRRELQELGQWAS